MSVQNVKNKPFIYGLTGGIASGKSTASNFFVENNIKVFDSDKCVKNLWETNDQLINLIKVEYSINIKEDSGKRELANIIFNNVNARMKINELIHPLVFKAIDKWLEQNKHENFVVIDMPLLFESNYELNVDKTIVVYTTRKKQIKRLMKRNNLSKKEATKRIDSQLDLKQKALMANYVLNNNKSMTHFEASLIKLLGDMTDENRG